MWLACRALLQPDPATGAAKLRLRVDHACAVQLSSPNMGTSSSGATVIESKKSMKARGVSSPDRADGALMAVYEPEDLFGHRRMGLIN
ncbi:hypothetical protein ACFVFS_34665 [Kitasatospora sp. NPDC057692]|uniref:hypothetical protein n=1 Tax=Kitasatospora sp. NPDC057692 TaxID=3346215 RepID=UPI0036796849